MNRGVWGKKSLENGLSELLYRIAAVVLSSFAAQKGQERGGGWGFQVKMSETRMAAVGSHSVGKTTGKRREEPWGRHGCGALGEGLAIFERSLRSLQRDRGTRKKEGEAHGRNSYCREEHRKRTILKKDGALRSAVQPVGSQAGMK